MFKRFGWMFYAPGDGAGGGDGGAGGGGNGDSVTLTKQEVEALRASAGRVEKLDRDIKEANRRQTSGQKLFNRLLESLGIESLPDDEEERTRFLDELKAKTTAASKGKTFTQEEVQRQLADRERKHQQAIEAATKRVDGYKGRLTTLMISNAARIAALEAGATEAGAEAIQLIIEREAALAEDEDSGEAMVELRDKNGRRLVNGAAMTIADRVKEISEDKRYDSFFRSSGSGGAGSRGAGGRDGRGTGGGGGGGAGKRRITAEEFHNLSQTEYEKIAADIQSGAVEIIAR